jgi:predicted DNA binding CopG/RHH family protein
LPSGTRSFTSSSDDGLEDDVATLSYDRALRAHARYRSTIQPVTDVAASELECPSDPSPAAPAAVAQLTEDRTVAPGPDLKRVQSTTFEKNLKSASITIRLSKAECAQLHRRAGDAGLTVSAYLRSCTFEAESLRAMVKDTLAELRLAKAQSKPAEPEPAPPRPSKIRRLSEWLARLLIPWHDNQRAARA